MQIFFQFFEEKVCSASMIHCFKAQDSAGSIYRVKASSLKDYKSISEEGIRKGGEKKKALKKEDFRTLLSCM